MSPISDTKMRILLTARKLFHNRSYADVGVKEICDLAKIQKGSFYHFFSSKQELAIAVIDDLAEDWADNFLAEAFNQKHSPMKRFDDLINAVYNWQKSAKNLEGSMPGCLFGNMALEVSTRDAVIRAKITAVFDKISSRFFQTLEEAIENGDLVSLDSKATAEAMLSYLEGVILLAKSRNDPDVFLKLAPAVKTLRVELKNVS